jgi:hypothetical protein
MHDLNDRLDVLVAYPQLREIDKPEVKPSGLPIISISIKSD